MKKIMLLSFFVIGMVFAAQAAQVSDSTLQQYVGRYKFPEGSVVPDVTVALDNGALTMTSTAGSSNLEKKEEDLYIIVQFQGTAKFNRNADKKIIGVSIDAMGYQLEGTKEASEALAVLKCKMYRLYPAGSPQVK